RGRRNRWIARTAMVPVAAARLHPAPARVPTAAAHHSVAAVLSPRTLIPSRMITPAPRNPIPDTTWAAIRGKLVTSDVVTAANITNSADPIAPSAFVLSPAVRWRH